jgi:hypothetical protein
MEALCTYTGLWKAMESSAACVLNQPSLARLDCLLGMRGDKKSQRLGSNCF